MKKKKAPKVKKAIPGYYAGGSTMSLQSTPEDYIHKPERKSVKDAKFKDYASDAGRLLLDNLAGQVGLDSLVKNTYKTEIGADINEVREKYIAPVQKAGATAILNYLAPGAGTAYSAATSTASAKSKAKMTERLPGETDEAYSARMAELGIDITDDKTGLQGTEGAMGVGVSSLLNGAEKKAEGGETGTKSTAKKYVIPGAEAKAYLSDSNYINNARTILDTKLRQKLKLPEDYPIPDNAYLSSSEVNEALKGTQYPDYYGTLKKIGDFYTKYEQTAYDMKGNPLTDFAGTQEQGVPIEQTAYGPRHRSLRLGTMGETKPTVTSDAWAKYLKDENIQTKATGGAITASKAKEILKDGTVNGQPLTKKRKGYFGAVAGGGKSEGGSITGPGTAKSDSIVAKVKKGSFIVPAENAPIAEDLRKEVLGKNNKKANLNQEGGEIVKLSNEEHMFSPEEVDELEDNGVDVDALAPNAEASDEMADGGGVGDDKLISELDAILKSYQAEAKKKSAEESAARRSGSERVKANIKKTQKEILVDSRYRKLKELSDDIKSKGKAGGYDVARIQRAIDNYKSGVERYNKNYEENIPTPTAVESSAKEVDIYIDSSGDKAASVGEPLEVPPWAPADLKARVAALPPTANQKVSTPKGVVSTYKGGAAQNEAPAADFTPIGITPDLMKSTALTTKDSLASAPDQLTMSPDGLAVANNATGATSPTGTGVGNLMSKVNPENALSFLQMGLGVQQLFADGQRPVDRLDPDFLASVERAKSDARFGFDPATRAAYERDINLGRTGAIGLAAQTAGADPLKANAYARLATNDYASNLAKLASADANLLLQKQRYSDSLVANKAAMKRQLFEDSMRAFDINQVSGADLLSSGIENFFTNRRTQQARDAEAKANAASNVDYSGLTTLAAELKNPSQYKITLGQ